MNRNSEQSKIQNQTSKEAEDFLKLAQGFKLGHLPTESYHPKTGQLSFLAKKNPREALNVLRTVDVEALTSCENHLEAISELRSVIREVWIAGRTVFCCGCGATGRLALTIESIGKSDSNILEGQLVSFMAGGDVALVHSLEGFEDSEAFGARHLLDLGFEQGDLLIAITEGGETPYVIGAVEEAERVSDRSPYFIFCNPSDVLCESVERSRRVLQNQNICKVEMFVGPMALAGSTRMQASTVLEWFLGEAVLHSKDSISETKKRWEHFLEILTQLNTLDWVPLLEQEAEIYQSGGRILYLPEILGITVFTDTTERAPTFNLSSFEPQINRKGQPFNECLPNSLCYVALPGVTTAALAWQVLLSRPPRALHWPEVSLETSGEYLCSFDFSEIGVAPRTLKLSQANVPEKKFVIKQVKKNIDLSLQGETFSFVSFDNQLYDHLFVKLLLNSHSTLVMGRLGRYESNLMTWVRPSNGKLIDRATRYVQQLLLKEDQPPVSYEEIVKALFVAMSEKKFEGSLVLKTLAALRLS